MDRVADVLSSMYDKGVRLWVDEGRLCYQAPKGALASEDMLALRDLKAEILDFFQRPNPDVAAEPPLKPRPSTNRVPFSLMQRSWWKGMQSLGGLRDTRVCADSNRILGPLHIEALWHSLDLMVQRHESLRTRIVEVDGALMHEIEEARRYDLEVIELPAMSATEIEAEARRLVDEVVHETTGPLFRARLVKLGDQDHVLVAAMQHIVSDWFSVDVLSRDVWTSYAEFVTGVPSTLPDLRIQHSDYVVWQHETQQWWLNKHTAYWKEHYFDAPDVKFPVDEGMTDGQRTRFAEVLVNFGEFLSSRLRALCRREHTTPMVGVMTIYAALLLRWHEKNDLVLAYLVTGRYRPGFENLIGFFVRPLCLRVQLKDDDTFLDLLRRVTHEYHMAYAHFDVSRIDLQVPAAGSLNWLPRRGSDSPGSTIVNDKLGQSEHAIRMEPFPPSDYELEVDNADIRGRGQAFGLMLSDTAGGISGSMRYGTNLNKASTMERLIRNLHLFAATLVHNPRTRVTAMSVSE